MTSMFATITNHTTIRSLALKDFSRISMNLSSPGWWSEVPTEPGWYAIETNTPFNVLTSPSVPSDLGKRYNIASRIQSAKFLIKSQLAITPSKPDLHYVVYSGEHGNLKARAREHTHGKKGTGCLCLSQYREFAAFEWTFLFRQFKNHVPDCADNKLLRTLLEQKWRAENGWPVICSQ